MLKTKPKSKKCRNTECRKDFMPAKPMQVACSPRCALELALKQRKKKEAAKAKQERAEHRAAKERIKTRSDHMREAQAVVNRYVRLRDRHDGCISCDKPATWQGQWHASHLRSVGSCGALRFNLWNIHKSCSVCNNHLSGNIADYLPRVREKIGDEKVEWIYAQNAPRTFDIEYLRRLKIVFLKKIRLLERREWR